MFWLKISQISLRVTEVGENAELVNYG